MMNLLSDRTNTPHEDEPRLADTLSVVERLLPRIARRLLFDVAAGSPLWDLTLPQLRTLHIVGHRRNLAMRDLAERLGVAMSTVTQIADRLEQRGWVRRVDDPEDRRVVRLDLTEAGQQVIAERHERRRQRLEESLSRMPADKREALVEGLRALNDSAGMSCQAGRESAPALTSSLLNWVREDLEPVGSAEDTD